MAEQDVVKELFALLSEAKEIYLHDVVDKNKRYDRFVDDFIHSHRYINCDNVVCQNCHEMNIHIVRGILSDYQGYVRKTFISESFSLEDCIEIKRMYDTSKLYSLNTEIRIGSSLSFGCNFTKEQMTGITTCVNTYHLFCASSVSVEDMEDLFACKEGFRIRVNNIRYVAVFFDALLEKSFIQAHWQSVLFRGKFLLSKDGNRTITASNLSSALSAAKNNMTSVFYAIKATINQILER